jgi:hypothetical protein
VFINVFQKHNSLYFSNTFHNVALRRHRQRTYISDVQRAVWLQTHTSHRDTEQSTIEAYITLDGITWTHCSGDHRINDLQFAGRYQCLPICSGSLIRLQNEHPIYRPYLLAMKRSWRQWDGNLFWKHHMCVCVCMCFCICIASKPPQSIKIKCW